MDNQTIHEGKSIAIISYITWIGTLIAFIMNNNKRNLFAAFHIRQMIGLSIFSLVNTFIIRRFAEDWTVGIIGLALFALWVIGFIGATQGEEKKVPLVGDLFQEWFKNIG